MQHLLHVDLVHALHHSGVVHSEAHLRQADEGASFRVSESGDKRTNDLWRLSGEGRTSGDKEETTGDLNTGRQFRTWCFYGGKGGFGHLVNLQI